MATKKPAKTSYRWGITLIRGSGVLSSGLHGRFLGYVEVSDEKSAIEEAIKQFEITNPEQQSRLIARRGKSAQRTTLCF